MAVYAISLFSRYEMYIYLIEIKYESLHNCVWMNVCSVVELCKLLNGSHKNTSASNGIVFRKNFCGGICGLDLVAVTYTSIELKHGMDSGKVVMFTRK